MQIEEEATSEREAGITSGEGRETTRENGTETESATGDMTGRGRGIEREVIIHEETMDGERIIEGIVLLEDRHMLMVPLARRTRKEKKASECHKTIISSSSQSAKRTTP